VQLRLSLFWDVTRCRIVVGCRRFETVYRSQRLELSSSLKIGQIGFKEKSLNHHLIALGNVPEERRPQFNPILETCWVRKWGKTKEKGRAGYEASTCFMAPDIIEKFYTNIYAASTSGADTVTLMYVMNAFAQTVGRY